MDWLLLTKCNVAQLKLITMKTTKLDSSFLPFIITMAVVTIAVAIFWINFNACAMDWAGCF